LEIKAALWKCNTKNPSRTSREGRYVHVQETHCSGLAKQPIQPCWLATYQGEHFTPKRVT
jgi:hypothetical protein